MTIKSIPKNSTHARITPPNVRQRKITVSEIERLRASLNGSIPSVKELGVRELAELRRFEINVIKAISQFMQTKRIKPSIFKA